MSTLQPAVQTARLTGTFLSAKPVNIFPIKVIGGIGISLLLISCAKNAHNVETLPPAAAKFSARPVDTATSDATRSPTVTLASNGVRGEHAYAGRPEVMRLAHSIAERNQLDPQWVQSMIGQARYLPAIAKATVDTGPTAPKNWGLYRRQFLNPTHIKAGIQFWKKHHTALVRAERETGVPAAIIVGILGVETVYGQNMGRYRVIDALCTLAFDFPATHPRASERAALFLRELEAFLKLNQNAPMSALKVRGSYAGAMGIPQFLPSSWKRYAVDFDGDGRIDLFASPADAIGSVANYLKTFKWKPGVHTHYQLQIDTQHTDLPDLLMPGIVPTLNPSAFAAKGGILEDAALQYPGPLALIELKNGTDTPLYIAGTENFYAVTRYNRSSYYALAVIELGQAISLALSSTKAP